MLGIGGKCPKCDQLVTNILLEDVPSAALMGHQFHTVMYLCPHCRTILSVAIDPIAIKTDILAALGRS